jgi:hypothetical protein
LCRQLHLCAADGAAATEQYCHKRVCVRIDPVKGRRSSRTT